MEALSEIGAVDERTMREFDEACLTSVEALSPDEIRALREDRVPGRGVRSVSRSGRRVIVSGSVGAHVRLRPQAG